MTPKTQNKGHELISLLDIISNFNSLKEPVHLYKRVNDYLVKNLKTNPMVVYSFPRAMKEAPEKVGNFEKFRSTWVDPTKKLFIYNTKILTKVVDQFFANFPTHEDAPIEIDGQIFYCHYIGDDEQQSYLAVFSLGDQSIIDPNLYRYLCKFWSNSFLQSVEWLRINNLNSLVHIDDVTGLFNQRKLLKDLENAIKRFEMVGEEFIVLFIDVDNFKNVNDGHGHLVGTFLLSQLGKVLKGEMRKTDLIYRYGGDEFVILIPCKKTANPRSIGERVLKAVMDCDFNLSEKEKFKLTVSIGAAKFPENAKTRKDILAMADQMMYQAKAEGKGRVCLAAELLDKAK